MLSIGVGETVTDGFKTYVLTSEFDYKFVSYGNHAQLFEGYDNSDCELTEVRVRRLKKLDNFEPDDDFNILKTLITQYSWTFGDGFYGLDDSNYSDESLRHYLEYGDVDFQED